MKVMIRHRKRMKGWLPPRIVHELHLTAEFSEAERFILTRLGLWSVPFYVYKRFKIVDGKKEPDDLTITPKEISGRSAMIEFPTLAESNAQHGHTKAGLEKLAESFAQNLDHHDVQIYEL